MNYHNNEIGYIGLIHFMSRLKGKKRFRKLYENVQNFETKFFSYYRMSIKSFDELLVLLTPHISRSNTSIRLAINSEERLTITIR